MAGKCRAIPTALVMSIVVAVVMAVAVTGVAAKDSFSLFDPSSLMTWSAPDCSGETSIIASPGCIDLVYYAGLEFHYRGEAATLYTGTGCTGTPYQLFEDTQTCGDFGWRSINIVS